MLFQAGNYLAGQAEKEECKEYDREAVIFKNFFMLVVLAMRFQAGSKAYFFHFSFMGICYFP